MIKGPDCSVMCSLMNDHVHSLESEDGDRGEDRSGNGDENKEEGGEKREPGNRRSGNRGGGLKDAREGATPTSNQQSQSQDATPQQGRRIMRRTRAQGREVRDRIGKGGGEAKERKKP